MALLYRGVGLKQDQAARGRLIPRGDKIEVVARYDGRIPRDGTFVHGLSENNAARAHQLDTGLYGGCFVSFSRSFDVAAEFALGNEPFGVVYVVDEAVLAQHGVVAKEFPDPRHKDEKEVSLRAHDGGPLPLAIVIDKITVELEP